LERLWNEENTKLSKLRIKQTIQKSRIMEELKWLVDRDHLNPEKKISIIVNEKAFDVPENIIKASSETVKLMMEGDTTAQISLEIEEEVETLFIRYLAIGRLDDICKSAIKENPTLVPTLIREGLRLQADVLMKSLVEILNEDAGELLFAASTNEQFCEDFVPFAFFVNNFPSPNLEKEESFGRKYMRPSKTLRAFDNWLANSSSRPLHQFLKELRKGAY